MFDSLSVGGESAPGRRQEGAPPATGAGRHAASEGSSPLLLLRRRRETGSGSEEEHPLRREDAAACSTPRRTKGGRPCPGGRPLLRRQQRGQHPQPRAVHPPHGQDAVRSSARGKKTGFPIDFSKLKRLRLLGEKYVGRTRLHSFFLLRSWGHLRRWSSAPCRLAQWPRGGPCSSSRQGRPTRGGPGPRGGRGSGAPRPPQAPTQAFSHRGLRRGCLTRGGPGPRGRWEMPAAQRHLTAAPRPAARPGQ